jgi:DNA-binding SARP family transcriptional activator
VAEALARIAEPAFWCAWSEGKQRSLSDLVGEIPSPQAEPSPPAVAAGGESHAPDLRIRTLGGLDVFVRGRRVERSEWGSSRARELLAFLACHPDGCTKAQIGLALWPEASPGQLRNTFHVTLHRLRHALALPEAIQVDGDRYRLNPSIAREFDAERFEHDARAAMRELRRSSRRESTAANDRDPIALLDAAVSRYRGDFLAGETVGEWADERRNRLHDLWVEALDALGRAQMERDRYIEAADAFRALLTVDPVNEEACRRQMICLAQLGDRASALRTYDALVRALRDELGVQPERETAALRDKLVSTT